MVSSIVAESQTLVLNDLGLRPISVIYCLCPPSKLLMQDGAKNGIYLAEYLEI